MKTTYQLNIKKAINYLSITLLIIAVSNCNAPPKQKTEGKDSNKINLSQSKQYNEVSIINLIATPKKYNGKLVRVMGYLNMKYENDAIYLHKEDYDLKLYKNSVGVEILRQVRDEEYYKKCNNKYVFVEGTFNMNRANEGTFNSSIVNITRIILR
jgi:hypothetical protein